MGDAAHDRFCRTDALFDAALDLEAGERVAFLDQACEGDTQLRADVLRLLRAHDRAGAFLTEPALSLAAPLLDASELNDVSADEPAPARIGPYRIEREIGHGGMGIVYLAERADPQFRQRVALKVMRSGPIDTRTLVPRFLAERQLLASLEHPHIARLFDGGITTEGLPYFTMAYYEGGSLADRLATREPLPLEQALRIGRQLAAALGAAHAVGIVHRDVKPANVLFDANGQVRLSDFGVAKLMDPESPHSGVVLGTVAYLAPEQVQGTPVDHRADLWALGVTLYEMLTGHRPFDGSSYAAVLHAIVNTQPEPVTRHAAAVPPAVGKLIAQLLEKAPAARPQSADAVVQALDALRSLAPAGGSARNAPWTARRRVILAVAILILVSALGLWAAWLRRSPPEQGASAAAAAVMSMSVARPSVGVLPFDNTSGDPTDEHFSDGLTDELISTLGKVPGLRVAGRTSAFALKGKDLDVRTIADTLHVATVLEGSVRRAGSRLKITAQLVSGDDHRVLWADAYDRELQDVFAIQEEIARAIATALRVKLAAGAGPGGLVERPTRDLAAYELYLKGRYHWNLRSRAGLRRAVQYFEQAIARDPAYAQAYAGLSDAHASIAVFGYGQPHEEFRKAKAAAHRALQLDSTLAEAHAALAHALFVYDYEWDAAERGFRRAIQLDPGYTFSRVPYAILLSTRLRFDEAVAQLDTARASDPLAFAVPAVLGRVYVTARQPDRAIPHLLGALELNPQSDLSYQQLGHAYLQKRMPREAIAALRKAAALSGIRDSAQLAYAYAVTGQREEAGSIVRQLVGSSTQRYVPPFHIAMAYVGLGNHDEAFRWLERGYAERASFMNGVKVVLAFEPLHTDPRWLPLLRRMGLEP